MESMQKFLIEKLNDNSKRLMSQFINIFLFDVLIGNVDRNSNNIGFIIDENNNINFSKLYDNESMLDIDSITNGKYAFKVYKDDDESKNALYEFLNVSDIDYSNYLKDKLWIISEENLKNIFKRIKKEKNIEIPVYFIENTLEKFTKNRLMILDVINLLNKNDKKIIKKIF
jgi:hypothetical protein